jgi:hypothetical protein
MNVDLKDKILSGLLSVLLFIPIYSSAKEIRITARGKRLSVTDYRRNINPRFKKIGRISTRFIIVHTSEAGLRSTLYTLSRGKKYNNKSLSKGGHAHYVVSRKGKVYYILSHNYRANHAGLSMWDGISDISSHSLGIELVGYHYGEITKAQYKSLSILITYLRTLYSVLGKNILCHSQVSYGNPNQWYRRPHRGRKRCALNFDRSRIGLKNERWIFDPDVKAGRLATDANIAKVFYPPVTAMRPEILVNTKRVVESSNVLSSSNTAWNIAGEDYKSANTLYVLPGGRKMRGDLIGEKIGWHRLPDGTRVLLNQPAKRVVERGPIYEISREVTAWSFAGKAFNSKSTFYYLPRKKIISGDKIPDWDSIPEGTQVIIGYRPPLQIKAKKGQTPWGIAGIKHNNTETVYFIPGNGLVSGDAIKDFNDLPQGTKIFLKR